MCMQLLHVLYMHSLICLPHNVMHSCLVVNNQEFSDSEVLNDYFKKLNSSLPC